MTQVEVSVVLPLTGLGAGAVDCLRSLAGQTLAAERFEVVVVHAGAVDEGSGLVDEVRSRCPWLRVRLVSTGDAGTAGTSELRNLGLAAARGAYVTFVGAGDTVSPELLASLLERSRPDAVGLGQVGEVRPDVDADFATDANRARLGRDEAFLPAEQLPEALGRVEAALFPTPLARSVGFDGDLSTGADVVFWARLLARAPLRLGLCPVAWHAVCFRGTTGDRTTTRAAATVPIGVRLDVVERLATVAAGNPSVEPLVRRLTADQVDLVNLALRERPEDHAAVVGEVRRRGLTTVPLDRLNRDLARDLAILYVALPYADTSAYVAARRIRKAEVLVDVLSSNMSTVRDEDEQAHLIWHEFVDRQAQTATTPTAAWWPRINDFCRQGLRVIEAWEQEKGPYRSVYSRAMWPTAHVLAALYKVRNPATPWIAEFSDPLLHGILGETRQSSGRTDPRLLDELRDGLLARGVTPPDGDNMYLWIETLAYGLADTLLFTNELQRTFMLGYCADPALARRALERSVVDAHPTLPPEFYRLADPTYELDPGVVNVGYFGVFYATRGLTEVVEALQSLRPDVRSRLRLHVFTARPDELTQQMRGAGLADVVVANPYVSYLEFLRLSTQFDVLLVNDARTADTHPVNPYMPSKWSDYSGSGRPIWGVVEPGSVMSTRPLTYCSALGDVAGARAVLEQVVDDLQRHDRAAPGQASDALANRR